MRGRALAIILPVLAVLAAGCSEKPATVTGDVTLDGQPVAEGLITYIPVAGKTPNVAVKIESGKYSARLPVGAYKVQIRSAKATGEKRKMYPSPDSPEVDVVVEGIPERYNTKTELQADIKPGENTLDWPLKSK